MNIYKKRVGKKETEITLLASHLGVAPHTIALDETIQSELYPTVFIDLSDEQKRSWIHKLLDKIKILHDNNIIHMDLSEENVVVNQVTGDLRIIDYGLSKYFNEITEQDKEEFTLFECLIHSGKYPNLNVKELEQCEAMFFSTISALNFLEKGTFEPSQQIILIKETIK